MTLKKIISIKNIGRFQKCFAADDVTFKAGTLVFAENGRGKTTLCAILRSLQWGEPAYILGRKTLGYPDEPEVEFLLETGPANFKNGAWSAPMAALAVFDETYIAENVHVGNAVDTPQRRNLYQVIIGSRGVVLARRVQDLDSQIREKSRAIKAARAVVQNHIPKGVTVEEFLTLAADDNIDARIDAKQGDLDAVKKADQIARHEGLSTVSLPELPRDFSQGLAKTVEDIAADAEQQIVDHMRVHHMQDRGEMWLSEGLSYVVDDDCPFCGQDLTGLVLIDSYKAYFSEAYHSLKDEVAKLAEQVDNVFGDADIATIRNTFEKNGQVATFWNDYCTFEALGLPSQTDLSAILANMRSAALSLLNRKKAAPLETLAADDNFMTAESAFTTLTRNIVAYNQSVATINGLIATKKEQAAAADVAAVAAELTRLNAQKTRHTQAVGAACQSYRDLLAEKRGLEGQKDEAKAELDGHTESVITQYGRSIKRYLDRFNAGFRISGLTHDYKGRIPSSSYEILINEMPVALGKPDTLLSEPSFKNTLSAGDRSTLALAFFFAQLEQDPSRAQKTVVLDDPFTSQDAFRRTQTAIEIKRCGDRCAQVVLLSHDPYFLKLVWDQLPLADRKTVQLVRVGEINTTIAEWDIEETVKARYRFDVEKLQRYYSDRGGNARDVVQKIRPVLESYCRNLYPSQFPDGDTLGTMIGRIRTEGKVHPLSALAEALENLNEYTKRYHHGENPNAATESIDDIELSNYVKRTLKIVGNLI